MLFSSALLAQQLAFKLFLLRLSLSPLCLQSDVRECCTCVYVCAWGPVCKRGVKRSNQFSWLRRTLPSVSLSQPQSQYFPRTIRTLSLTGIYCVYVFVRTWLFFSQCKFLLRVEKTYFPFPLLFNRHADAVVLLSFAQVLRYLQTSLWTVYTGATFYSSNISKDNRLRILESMFYGLFRGTGTLNVKRGEKRM